jgi:TPR repeat protein
MKVQFSCLLIGVFQLTSTAVLCAQSLTARQILANNNCVKPQMLSQIDKGEITAEEALAASYENGYCFSKDERLAAYWYRKAAELGNARVQNTLGSLYENGKGVPRDYRQAAFWYRKAADQGDMDAQNNLANMYADGEGFIQDYAQAVYWYQKAAGEGQENAELQLGQLYDLGHGVPQNYEQAGYWYRKAAEQGNAWAQYSLGQLYSDGHGFDRDYIEAYFWLDLAAASFEDQDWMQTASYLRDQTASHLTGIQLHEVQARVATWTDAHPQKPCVRVDQQTTSCFPSRHEMNSVLDEQNSHSQQKQ